MKYTYVLYRYYKSLDTFNLYLITFPQLPRLRLFNSLISGPDDTIHESLDKKFTFPELPRLRFFNYLVYGPNIRGMFFPIYKILLYF